MSAKSGRWLSGPEFARAAGMTAAELRQAVRKGSVLAKTVAGREYLWAEGPDRGSAGRSADQPGPLADPGREGPDPGDEADPHSTGPESEAVTGTLVSRFSWPQEIVLQTERALSLVERSLSTFMLMHKEVMAEKDRFTDQSRKALESSNREFLVKDERINELEQLLKEKDQEIADLKMLVGILEDQTSRVRARAPEGDHEDKASVGDLMEDQLRYIMEDQLIKELLKE